LQDLLNQDYFGTRSGDIIVDSASTVVNTDVVCDAMNERTEHTEHLHDEPTGNDYYELYYFSLETSI